MSDYHAFAESLDPRKENSCQRCGRIPSAPCHISLLDRVEGLREAYLGERLAVEDLAVRLPDGWSEYPNDPEGEGKLLARLMRGYLAEFQCGLCDESTVRNYIAETR